MSENLRSQYILKTSPLFERISKTLKKKKPSLLALLEKQITKVLREPLLGKPLRNVLKNYRRIHLGSFVLVYKIEGNEIHLIDFDHHDKIYKKY